MAKYVAVEAPHVVLRTELTRSITHEGFLNLYIQVVLLATLNGVPATADGPSLECLNNTVSVPAIAKVPAGYNCEPLSDKFQVRWAVQGTDVAIELVGIVGATDYMGFGPSGLATKTFMVGADPVVVDTFSGKFRARDFYMNDRSQCNGENVVCPDTERVCAVYDVSAVSGERDLGCTLVRYKKPLTPSDVNATAVAGSELTSLSRSFRE